MNYGQVSPNPGPNLAQPYQPQQALPNNSETFSKSVFLLVPNVI